MYREKAVRRDENRHDGVIVERGQCVAQCGRERHFECHKNDVYFRKTFLDLGSNFEFAAGPMNESSPKMASDVTVSVELALDAAPCNPLFSFSAGDVTIAPVVDGENLETHDKVKCDLCREHAQHACVACDRQLWYYVFV